MKRELDQIEYHRVRALDHVERAIPASSAPVKIELHSAASELGEQKISVDSGLISLSKISGDAGLLYEAAKNLETENADWRESWFGGKFWHWLTVVIVSYVSLGILAGLIGISGGGILGSVSRFILGILPFAQLFSWIPKVIGKFGPNVSVHPTT